MALYTGKGDDGTTKTLDSKERFSKASERAEALGTLDELNSFFGWCKVRAAAAQDEAVRAGRKTYIISEILDIAQRDLFIVQAQVAGAEEKKITRPKVARIEAIIAAIEAELPVIKGFTIAGGTDLAAVLDVARTHVRRTERRVVAVHDSGERKLTKHTLAYLNRLSSLLFALARFSNYRSGVAEQNPDYR